MSRSIYAHPSVGSWTNFESSYPVAPNLVWLFVIWWISLLINTKKKSVYKVNTKQIHFENEIFCKISFKIYPIFSHLSGSFCRLNPKVYRFSYSHQLLLVRFPSCVVRPETEAISQLSWCKKLLIFPNGSVIFWQRELSFL